MTGAPLHRYTYPDYVALEEVSTTKHEFLNGEIYAMAGGSEDHSALSAEVLRILGNAAADGPCRVHTSDLRIYAERSGLATFSDGSVLCEPLDQHPPSPVATALNPTVLLEVTSDSSEACDTGPKKDCDLEISTLREYIVVAPRECRVTVHRRNAEGRWTSQVAISGGQVEVESVGAALDVDALYWKNLNPIGPSADVSIGGTRDPQVVCALFER